MTIRALILVRQKIFIQIQLQDQPSVYNVMQIA